MQDNAIPMPSSSDLLTLREIAAWQVPEALAGPPSIVATLPALQRGAVWKPQQIEAIWDSMVRGFPVGAFMLTPYDQDRGEQKPRHQQPGVANPTHHLLDGQQRSTAIALGFLNPWVAEDVKAVLWVDLAEPTESSDMDFVFRVVTRSHPWGYRRSDPTRTIEKKRMRSAMDDYRNAAPPEFLTVRPRAFPLNRVWPVEAECPIPVPIIIEAILAGVVSNEELARSVLDRMATLPFWGDGTLAWQQSVRKALNGGDATGLQRFQLLAQGLRSLLDDANCFRIPYLRLPAMPFSRDGKQDPVETLFIRVNQGGTRLDGEELIYSILKSTWTDAPELLEKIGHQLAVPSRLVILCSRLVLAQRNADAKVPLAPDVSRFRRLMNGSDSAAPTFADDLKRFVENDGHLIFRSAKDLLTKEQYGLPPVLATELAQKSPAVVFLLLRWIVRMQEQGLDPLGLKPKSRKKLLGFVTALGWFGHNSEQAIAAVWPRLQVASGSNLVDFFSPQSFADSLSLGQQGNLRMLPLVPPDVLATMIQDSVTRPRGGGYGGFGDVKSEFWRNWNWFQWMSGRMSGKLEAWFNYNVKDRWNTDGTVSPDDGGDPKLKCQEAWTAFINKLHSSHSILLYAQRQSLTSWFPDFDPSQPDQLEDVNRPWDMDHIHPQRFLQSDNGNNRRNIPTIIWDWHRSIGNLRAWPLELNRSDSDTAPEFKLGSGLAGDKIIEKTYGLSGEKAKRKASVIGVDWDNWQASVPAGWYPQNYLAYSDDYGANRQALIHAITTRFVALYREWYETLEIASLMSRSNK